MYYFLHYWLFQGEGGIYAPLTISGLLQWVTRRLSYRIQELREHLGSPLIFDGVRAHVALILCFLCCVILHIFFFEWRRITWYEGVKYIMIPHDPPLWCNGDRAGTAPNSVDRWSDSRSDQTKDWYLLLLHYDPTSCWSGTRHSSSYNLFTP
jgi:hypothetical protein